MNHGPGSLFGPLSAHERALIPAAQDFGPILQHCGPCLYCYQPGFVRSLAPRFEIQDPGCHARLTVIRR